MAVELRLDLSKAQKQRVLQLNESDEIRQNASQHTIIVQEHRTKWHDKFIKKNNLNKGTRHFFFILDLKISRVN